MLSLIAGIGNFIPGLLGKELSTKAARIVSYVTLGIALLALLSLGKCAYDDSVINKHETAQRAEQARRQLEAERKANEELARHAAEYAESQRKLEDAAEEALRRDPAGAAKPVGPVSQSYYDNLPKKDRK